MINVSMEKDIYTCIYIQYWGENLPKSKFIEGAMEIIIGIILLPILAGFIIYAQNDPNVSALTGLSLLLTIIGYAFAFGLIGAGIKTMRS